MMKIKLSKEQQTIVLKIINNKLNSDLIQSRIDQLEHALPVQKRKFLTKMAGDVHTDMKRCQMLWAYWVVTGNGDKMIQNVIDEHCPDFNPDNANELLGEFIEILHGLGVTSFS